MRLERLAQHEARLREGSLGCVDHEDDAVDHGQAALDLATEVGVAGRVDDVDRHTVREAEGLSRGTPVVHGCVLGQDGDALLPLKVSGIHDALTLLFDGVTFGEGAGLPEHRVNQRGLPMIDVCDDGDISQVRTRGHMWTPQTWIRIIACDRAQ